LRLADVLTSFISVFLCMYCLPLMITFRSRVYHPEGCARARCGEPRLVLVLGVESSTSVVLLLLYLFSFGFRTLVCYLLLCWRPVLWDRFLLFRLGFCSTLYIYLVSIAPSCWSLFSYLIIVCLLPLLYTYIYYSWLYAYCCGPLWFYIFSSAVTIWYPLS
jgi:hypothetical protein